MSEWPEGLRGGATSDEGSAQDRLDATLAAAEALCEPAARAVQSLADPEIDEGILPNLAREAYLGFLALGLPNSPDSRAILDEIWRQSIGVAVTAAAINAKIVRDTRSNESFVAGLLHDLGRFMLAASAPKAYARVMAEMENRRIDFCEAECKVYGFDHTLAGRRLAMTWRLPAAVMECAWLHHSSRSMIEALSQTPQRVLVVKLATKIVERNTFSASWSALDESVGELASNLGVEHEFLVDLGRSLAGRIAEFEFQSLASETAHHLHASSQRLSESLAISNFLGSFREGAQIEDVCEAAANSLRSWLHVETAWIGAICRGSEIVHWGIAIEGKSSQRGCIEGRLQPTPPTQSNPAWLPTTDEVDRLCRRCGFPELGSASWTLRLTDCVSPIECVMVINRDSAMASRSNGPGLPEALFDVMAAALRAAFDRRELHRRTENIVAIHQCLLTKEGDRQNEHTLSWIAEMAAGAAHELNNPLAVISGRAQMELHRTVDPERSRVLKIISDQAQRASDLVSALMRFAKPDAPAPATLRLADVLMAAALRRSTLSALSGDRIGVFLADERTTVFADPHQFDEVLDALLANAVEACKPDKVLVKINSPSVASDETIRIVIEDEGVGMSPQVLRCAPAPFFSSRPAGRGRGMGLSRAARLIEINGGRLRLESAPETGTRVTLELPARGNA